MMQSDDEKVVVAMEVAGAESIPMCNTSAQEIPNKESDN